jgi:hypothetical protein
VAFKAAWVTELDETAMQCDLVLPLLSPLEDFGTHVAANQFDGVEISIQQPLMEKLYPETRSFGDVVLDSAAPGQAGELQGCFRITTRISRAP